MRAMATCLAFFHGFENDRIGLLGDGPVGRQIIRCVEKDRIDRVGIDEAVDIDGLAGLDRDLVELLGCDGRTYLSFSKLVAP